MSLAWDLKSLAWLGWMFAERLLEIDQWVQRKLASSACWRYANIDFIQRHMSTPCTSRNFPASRRTTLRREHVAVCARLCAVWITRRTDVLVYALCAHLPTDCRPFSVQCCLLRAGRQHNFIVVLLELAMLEDAFVGSSNLMQRQKCLWRFLWLQKRRSFKQSIILNLG